MLNQRHPRTGGSRGRPGAPLPTSCAQSSSGSGPGRWGCSRTSTAGSRSRSLSATPAPRTRAVWASAPSGVPGAPAILRWPEARAAFRQAPPRSRGPGRRARARHPPSAGPEPGGDDQDAQRADQAARAADRDRHPRAPRRSDLPLVVQEAERRDHGRGAVGGDRRLPRALPPATPSPPTPAGRRRGQSGKRKTACFRWACNKRLHQAFVTLADASRHRNPWAQDLYAAASARGHDHPRAIRTVGRGWCRIVWRCWQDGVPYDPARHRALQRHVTVTIPTSSGPRPDTAATQRMAGAAVTERAARRAERDALDGKPTSAIALGG